MYPPLLARHVSLSASQYIYETLGLMNINHTLGPENLLSCPASPELSDRKGQICPLK